MNTVLMHDLAPRLAAAILARRSAPLPAMPIGEWFSLEVDYEVDRKKFLSSVDPSDYIFYGPVRAGKRIYRVRLIQLGLITHLGEAKLAAKQENQRFRLLEGEAIESFRLMYPRYKDGPIAFGGSQWQHRVTGERYIAFLGHPHEGPFWDPGFAWDGSPFHENWYWAVVEDDE